MHAKDLQFVVDAMELLNALSVKAKVALLQQVMATTFPVQFVISLDNAESAAAQESVFAPSQKSQDTLQDRTLFMEQMEVLFLLIVLRVAEVLPLVLHLHRVHVRHHLHVVPVADVVVRELIRLQVMEEECPHGWHTIIAMEMIALIVIIMIATCMKNARHVTYLDNIIRVGESSTTDFEGVGLICRLLGRLSQ